MRKILLALFTTVLILSNTGSANAAEISTPATQHANMWSTYSPNGYDKLENYPLNLASVEHDGGGKMNGLLQFQIDTLPQADYSSYKFKLYGLKEDIGDIEVYAVKFNTWTEGDVGAFGSLNAEKLFLSNLTDKGNNIFETESISQSFVDSELNNYIQNGKISLLLSPHDSVNPCFIYLTDDYMLPYDYNLVLENNSWSEYDPATLQFFENAVNSPGDFRPALIAEIAPAPVPEPSSMILGLMGLGSMLGFRRKKSA